MILTSLTLYQIMGTLGGQILKPEDFNWLFLTKIQHGDGSNYE